MTASAGIPQMDVAPLVQLPGGEWGTRVGVFEQIFTVFLVLGTIVGIVVIGYSLYNAVKYRDSETSTSSVEDDRPTLGELPIGGGGGKKLFLSFGISAIIVISLIAWTYGALLYVEAGPVEADDGVDVEVEALQFAWEFHYENGHVEPGTLVVPVDQVVNLDVTSRDVWHTFGIPDLRVKADAIPGQVDETWFIAEETDTYEGYCYELCGIGHSGMTFEVEVLSQEEFDEWYAEVGEEAEEDDGNG